MPWQPTSIIFPAIEQVVPPLLRAELAAEGQTDVWVGRKLPSPTRPPRAIQVLRDGGNVVEFRDQPRVRFLIWDTTDTKADDLACLVVALLPRLVGQGVVVSTKHLSGPYEIADTAPKRYVLAQIDIRGDAL